ncbi:hypothetical protein COLO4_05410 [Corchorus olitorius]|uniref:Uncharacterized protein n=1 Tax=Corchorus olitorius TaxID=93759 RepID=A0A1R3KQZ4_9ROSI|nr:hypothetical protein COLO4_05410 [Corchorus olitorius]
MAMMLMSMIVLMIVTWTKMIGKKLMGVSRVDEGGDDNKWLEQHLRTEIIDVDAVDAANSHGSRSSPVAEDPILVIDTRASPIMLPMTGPGVSPTISHVANVAVQNTYVFATITTSTHNTALGSPTFGTTAASSHHTTFGTTRNATTLTTLPSTMTVTRGITPSVVTCGATTLTETETAITSGIVTGTKKAAFGTSSESASAFALFASTSSITIDFHDSTKWLKDIFSVWNAMSDDDLVGLDKDLGSLILRRENCSNAWSKSRKQGLHFRRVGIKSPKLKMSLTTSDFLMILL